MKKKIINLLMLSTIIMSQMTFGLTAFAVEEEIVESSEVTVEDTSSTEEETTENDKIKTKASEEKTSIIGPLTESKSTAAIDTRAQALEVELNYYIEVPLATKQEYLKGTDFINKVTYNGRELDEDEYIAEILNPPGTHYVDLSETKIEVRLASDESIKVVEEMTAEIFWKDTIVSRDGTANNSTYVTVISLLEHDNKPYLSMSGGKYGDNASSRAKAQTRIAVYRNSTNNSLFDSTSGLSQTNTDILGYWMPQIDELELEYGDVLSQEVIGNSDGTSGKLTYVSRDEKLVKETEGFKDAFYELTPNGYRLLQLNQMSVSKDIPAFEVGTSIKEMNKVAINQMELAKGLNADDFRFEYASVDTQTTGTKKTKMNVYEKLETGDEFMMTYDVSYQILEGALNITLDEETVFAGVDVNTLNPGYYVTGIFFGKEEQANAYFTSEFAEEPNTKQVGPQITKIKVTEDSNQSNFVISNTITNVLWGNTLATTSTTNASLYESSVSMLNVNGKPSLRATEGTGLSTSSSLTTEPNFSVYRNNDTTKLYEAKTTTKSQTAKKLMETWQADFNKYSLAYGDVVSYTVPGQKGANTVASRSEKVVKETAGFESAYYELTKNGYSLMRVNQFTVKSEVPKFDINTTHADMNKKAAEQLNLPTGAIASNYRIEYASVDTTTPGAKTTKMNVYEKLSTGKEFMTTYDVSYEVIGSLEVELQEVSIPLGTKAELLNPNDYVKEVKVDNKVLSPSEYTASFVNKPNTTVVSTNTSTGAVKKQTTQIKVETKENKQTLTNETETTIIWENTITTKSRANTATLSAVSLLEESGKPYLRASTGVALVAGALQYNPTISLYRGDINSKVREDITSAGWESTAAQTMSKWNTEFGTLDLKYGDVLGYSVIDGTTKLNSLGSRTWVTRNEEPVLETEGFENAYYEVTKDGYHLLRFNQMKVSDTIPSFGVGATKAEMDNAAANQMILPAGAESKDYRFEYASIDTKTAGTKTTKMNVYEKLATGGEFMTTYDVSYKITESLRVELQPVSVPVGTDKTSINAADYVKDVYLGSAKVDKTNYTVTVDNSLNTSLVGSQSTKVTVTLKTGDKETITETTNTNILWGNNIGAYRKSDSTSFDSSVSMIDASGKPSLRANEGSGLSTHSSLNTQPNLSVYRNNDSTKLYEAKTTTKSQTAQKLMSTWQSDFNKYSLVYGDVVSYTVPSQKGANTVTARSEKLVKETEGFNSAYYELTKDGYRLMHANQFTVKSTVPQFDKGTSLETMNNQAASQLNLPTGAIASDYRIEYASADTTTVGKKTTKMNVYEKLATGGEFMTTYDVSYEVVQTLEALEIELQEVKIPVGTKTELLNANDYVKEVRLGDKKLAPSEYTASFVKIPKTNTVSTKTAPGDVRKEETKISIETNSTKQTMTGTTETNVIWANTITTKSSSEVYSSTSISLLDNNGTPYLAANEGVLFSSSNLTFNPEVSVHRNNIDNSLLSDGTNAGTNKKPAETMDKWNTNFNGLNLQYGDVFGYTISESNGTNSLGKRTWASRNEELVLETEGFDTAYYEMTKEGYRLMRFNQFEANATNPAFEIGTSKEEMDQVAAKQLKLPAGAVESDYRFEYVSVDTATSGTKTTKMNVYEKLATSGEFMTTYDVQYDVSSVLTEKYVDDAGKELKTETQSLTSGQAYQPKPENYITIDGELYIYQGWLTSAQTPGKDTPKEGNPPAVNTTTTYQYVYSKADNMINVTVPTEMVFGTYKSGSSSISSGAGVVKNNSKDTKTEVIMGEFKKEKSSVTLLKPSDSSPLVLKEKKARLNLTADKKEVISSLNESDKDKTIKELAPGEETTLGMTGKYYGDLNKTQKVQYKMILKFKAKQ